MKVNDISKIRTLFMHYVSAIVQVKEFPCGTSMVDSQEKDAL